MGGVARVEERQAGAVEAHAVEMFVVDVLTRLATVAAEVEDAFLVVQADDPAGPERAARDWVLELAVFAVQVEVTPAGSLGPPDELLLVLHGADALGLEVPILRTFAEESIDLPCHGIEGAVLDVAQQAIPSHETQTLRFLVPGDVLVALVLPLRLHPRQLLGVPTEVVQLGSANPLFAGHRVLVGLQRGAWIGDRIDQEEVLQPT